MTEQQIQKKIIDHYQNAGFLVVKLIKTNQNGIPDLMVLKNGICKFVEVKKPNGKIAQLQNFKVSKFPKPSRIPKFENSFRIFQIPHFQK